MKVEEKKLKFNLQLFAEGKKDEEVKEEKPEKNEEDLSAKELKIMKTEKELLEKKLESFQNELESMKVLEEKLKAIENEKILLEEAIKKSKDESLQNELKEKEKLQEKEKRIKRERETLDALEKAKAEKERIEKEAKEKEIEFQNKMMENEFKNDLRFEKLQKPWLADVLDKVETRADYESFKKFYPEEKQRQLQKDYELKSEAGSLYKHTEVSGEQIPKKEEEIKDPYTLAFEKRKAQLTFKNIK